MYAAVDERVYWQATPEETVLTSKRTHSPVSVRAFVFDHVQLKVLPTRAAVEVLNALSLHSSVTGALRRP
ncbi:hypothetical protein [Streptomyces nymphaeiformis]|uniref:Uncharacterized protein n=1 Tax=Streptomyces nymphaeiformis TaxID=2663842 RepID=A0A7W7U686_9ACTN|nr:hypothetical protein [Streptomyces nymphaeiformis]MBB4985746.1 hypothetical protein [Streptomyces nymphaeiformis]